MVILILTSVNLLYQIIINIGNVNGLIWICSEFLFYFQILKKEIKKYEWHIVKISSYGTCLANSENLPRDNFFQGKNLILNFLANDFSKLLFSHIQNYCLAVPNSILISEDILNILPSPKNSLFLNPFVNAEILNVVFSLNMSFCCDNYDINARIANWR